MADIPMLLLAVHTDIALAYFASIGALFVRAKFRLGVHLVSLLAFRKKQVCERTPFFTRPRYSVVRPAYLMRKQYDNAMKSREGRGVA
jgi:hypothetical protein